jgi:hypothetical protein
MGEDHSWMYNGCDRNGAHSNEWVAKTTTFVNCAFSLSSTSKVRVHATIAKILSYLTRPWCP